MSSKSNPQDTLSVADIDQKIDGIRREIFENRMQKSTMGLEKPHEAKNKKKEIARLLTIKTMKLRGNK